MYIFQFGTGSCSGDSGGPLVFHDKLSNPSHYVQIGIVQGGAGQCGNERFPGVYARLDDHDVLDFIYKTAFGKTIDSPLSFEEYDYYEYDSACVTVDGPKVNKPCIFPFTFNGKIVNTCITGRRRTRPWCSIKENYERGEWGYCSKACPTEGKCTKLKIL